MKIPPGESIKDQLEYRNLTVDDLSKALDLSVSDTHKLLNGDSSLTDAIAIKLEKFLNIPARFWLNLEMIYRSKNK